MNSTVFIDDDVGEAYYGVGGGDSLMLAAESQPPPFDPSSSTTTTMTNMVMPPRGYKALCIGNLLSSSIASVLCLVLIVAMTVPLLYHPTTQRRKRYSTYNLYLAFMAIPDLIHHVLIVYLVLVHEQWNPHPYDPLGGGSHPYDPIGNGDGEYEYENSSNNNNNNNNNNSYENNNSMIDEDARYIPDDYWEENGTSIEWIFDYRWDHSVSMMAVAANLYVNAFLTWELYGLLRSSNQRKKHPPPTLARVTAHATISYGLGVLMFFIPVLLLRTVGYASTVAIVGSLPYFAFVTVYVAIIPLSVVAVISIRIARGELLPSGGSTAIYGGRLRVLVVYFARIVLSDLLLWIPAVVLYLMSYAAGGTGPTKIMAYHGSLLFTAFQSIALFGCSLAKPDARKLLSDLVRCRCCCLGGGDDDYSDGETPSRHRRSSSGILSSPSPRLPRGRTRLSTSLVSAAMTTTTTTDPFLGRLTTGRDSVATVLGISLETSDDDDDDEDEDENHNDNDIGVEDGYRKKVTEDDDDDDEECEPEDLDIDIDIDTERENAGGDNPGEP